MSMFGTMPGVQQQPTINQSGLNRNVATGGTAVQQDVSTVANNQNAAIIPFFEMMLQFLQLMIQMMGFGGNQPPTAGWEPPPTQAPAPGPIYSAQPFDTRPAMPLPSSPGYQAVAIQEADLMRPGRNRPSEVTESFTLTQPSRIALASIFVDGHPEDFNPQHGGQNQPDEAHMLEILDAQGDVVARLDVPDFSPQDDVWNTAIQEYPDVILPAGDYTFRMAHADPDTERRTAGSRLVVGTVYAEPIAEEPPIYPPPHECPPDNPYYYQYQYSSPTANDLFPTLDAGATQPTTTRPFWFDAFNM